jgi:hypothetical protein
MQHGFQIIFINNVYFENDHQAEKIQCPRKGTNSRPIGSSETAPDNDNKAGGYGRE